jgi:hypothetical protein
MAQPGHLPTSANNALPGASAAVPAVPVLTKQQAEHQHNGCVDHRLDKLHLTISKHPHLQPLFAKLRSISSHMHKSSQSLDHAVACAKVVGVEFTTIKSIVETRWYSLYTHVDSFYANKKTLIWQRDSPKNSLVPPAVYELSDHDWIVGRRRHGSPDAPP